MKFDNIFICYPIFSPNEYMFNQNKNSLQSLGRWIRKHDIKIDIVLGGFCEEQYWDQIIDIIKNEIKPYVSEVKFFKFEKNFGKAYCVNNMVRRFEKSKEKQFMFTCDSDIIFKEDENLLETFIECANEMEKITGIKTGLIAPNIEQDNGHWIDKFQQKVKTVNGHIIIWPNEPVGIQGCCLFINMESWRKINGYQIIGVYGYDDALLLQDMYKHRFGYYVIENKNVIHPGTWDNKKYQDWKVKYFERQKGMTYRELIEKTEDFWREIQ
jgi:hypothetical protein